MYALQYLEPSGACNAVLTVKGGVCIAELTAKGGVCIAVLTAKGGVCIAVFTAKVGVCIAVLTASDVSACLVASGFGPSNTAVKIIVIVLQ